MKITAILPVSRIKYLDRVLESLQNQTIVPNNLVVVYDGPDSNYLFVRNKIIELEGFDDKLVMVSNNTTPAPTIHERRIHITNVHNQIRESIGDCDWVFSIEDDGILPIDALEKLVKNTTKYDNVGVFTGVELGRWGKPYVGAWHVDNVDEPKVVESLDNKTYSDEIDEIDACGLYCALVRADIYKSHEFFTRNGLGPDVNLALYSRQQGYKNYIDWSIHVTHLTNLHGDEIEIKPTDKSTVVKLHLLAGSTWGH